MGDLQTPFPPSFRHNFKPLAGVQNGGVHADVFLPEQSEPSGNPLPVAIMYHGGGFTIGGAQSIPFNQVRYLLSKGFVVVSFEYRKLPHVDHTAIRDDLIDGYKWIQDGLNETLKKRGSILRVDPSRCCAMGWSAGGTATLWLAADIVRHNGSGTDDRLPPLRACIPTYASITLSNGLGTRKDFDEFVASDEMHSRMWAAIQEEEVCTSWVPPLPQGNFKEGDTPKVISGPPDASLPPRQNFIRMAIASKSLNAFLVGQDPPFPSNVAPAGLVTSSFPPTMVVVATADSLLPPQQSYDLHTNLKSLGVDTALVECVGMKHGEAECLPGLHFWRKDSPWWGDAIRPSLDWAIERCNA